MTENIKIFSFDTGIQQILQGSDSKAPFLPTETAPLLPSEDHLSRRLDELFKAPSLDNYMLSALKPELQDKNILLPVPYKTMLKNMTKSLRREAEKKGGKGNGSAIEEAAAFLEEEGELMELLNTYRNILHQA